MPTQLFKSVFSAQFLFANILQMFCAAKGMVATHVLCSLVSYLYVATRQGTNAVFPV